MVRYALSCGRSNSCTISLWKISYSRGYENACVYMAPRSYSALGNTRMFNKFTEVSPTFQLFIHTTKITNFGSQKHNLFLECYRNQPVPPPPPPHPQYFTLKTLMHAAQIATLQCILRSGTPKWNCFLHL